MKNYITAASMLFLLACGNSSSKDKPSAIGNSTQHPNGTTNSSVISRDTASIAGDSTQRSRDTMPNK